MLAVSNTSPLRRLIPVGQAVLLLRLFTKVLIPPSVAAELSDAGSPLAVRQWIALPPSWLQIHPLNSPPDAELTEAPDGGEREAIGVLGILGEAYHQGLIDDPRYLLAEMLQQGFRISEQLAARFQVLLSTRYAR